MGQTGQDSFEVTAEDWRWLYQTAMRQALVGLLWTVAKDKTLPMDVAMQWASEAESIRGMNGLLNQEAARLTREFAEKGRKTAILKGQANARLYTDKYARQPGDIDIWVEGGRKSVLALLKEMNVVSNEITNYHHVHLPPNEKGVTVEVHFRPSFGNFNPFTNRRLQRWLEHEIQNTTAVSEGFNVPSVRFAMVMQLAHIQRHFLGEGIGLRQICDYYLLLRNATKEDCEVVSRLLNKFGLRHAAGALMWVLGEVLHLDEKLMLCERDSYRGEWMLREMMAGGNFGRYAKRQQCSLLKWVLEGKRRHLQLMHFDFWEIFWLEVNYWKTIVMTLPTRIKYRTLSLRYIPR